MNVLSSSLLSYASLGSHNNSSFNTAYEIVKGQIDNIMKVSFPYIDLKSEENHKTKEQTIDELFDELDEINKAEQDKNKQNSQVEQQ